MKLYLVVEISAECSQKHIKHRLEVLRSIYGKRHGTAQQTERRKHAYQPKAVVAMNVRYEYCHNLVEANA